MLDQNYNMLVPGYVMSLIYPLQSNIILFALCRLGKYVNKTYTFFLFCSWKSLCLRFLFPEAIPPSLSTLALPTWARRLGMVKKASKVMIKGKYLPILENMCHCIYIANGNNSSTYNLILDRHQVWRSHDPMSIQTFDFCEKKMSYPLF